MMATHAFSDHVRLSLLILSMIAVLSSFVRPTMNPLLWGAVLAYVAFSWMQCRKQIGRAGREMGADTEALNDLQNDEARVRVTEHLRGVWRDYLLCELPPDRVFEYNRRLDNLALTEHMLRRYPGESLQTPPVIHLSDVRATLMLVIMWTTFAWAAQSPGVGVLSFVGLLIYTITRLELGGAFAELNDASSLVETSLPSSDSSGA